MGSVRNILRNLASMSGLRVCPKTGRRVFTRGKGRVFRPLYILIGLAALVWHLVRVLPRPSRATYPCQRVAGPIAWSFLASLLAWPVALLTSRRAQSFLRERRYVLAGFAVVLALGAVSGGLVASALKSDAMFTAEAKNSPIGVARGTFPGRVVWCYDPAAATWDGSTGYWWEDRWNSQTAVDAMMSSGLKELTGAATDAAAWDALFRHSNAERGRGENGYQAGETIAVKINLNNQGSGYACTDNHPDASPHMVLALLRQLVNQAGVPPASIVVYDAVRNIPDKIFNKCRAEFPQVVFLDATGTNGRTPVQWTGVVIGYGTSVWPDGSPCGQSIPKLVYQAAYSINMALLKCHGTAGVTLTAKNFYGTINGREHWYIQARSRTMPLYNPLVDLLGQKNVGAKTMLFMIDALYGTSGVDHPPKRFQWAPFNNRWSSSLFLSQDPVAIDSVGTDFLVSEFNSSYLVNADNYLHEAALANSPPSGTVYDPEWDGIRLKSLGTHEHWNDNVNRQYSRDLETGSGIELLFLASADLPTDSDGDGLTDGWESQYFRTLTGARPGDDPDGDAYSNLDEATAGTDARDAMNFFQAAAVEAGEGGVLLRWNSAAGRTYRVARAAAPGGPFVEEPDDIPATPPQNTWTNP
ncbi:MAG: DUF362 domain-containing protein, partial [Verrucomicrobia bacterium]|nr:DUF362 domain-containing protein [Verrucomicrobiota bacterium]